MSGDVVTELPRPRPLSGGLWTLFSWLRREEHSSSDSLSSAGSDRTAASFAFLAPAHYGAAAPAPLPPLPPPTDSYRKRVRDRNLRRQHDRDITLHRKYGLYGFGYDAFSLPSGRRSTASGDRCERDRRATSECPRAHVPGKRRAPLPPAAPTSLTRRRARKRPAPLPPINLNKENNPKNTNDITEPMNRPPSPDRRPQHHENGTGCKPEKYSKKDAHSKDVKLRHDKNFLRQIFENRKRNSTIETPSVKLLPNISELDKQAAEMIEKYRLKELTHNDTHERNLGKSETSGTSKEAMEAWICTRCLRKYNSSVITCNYCLPLNKINDSYKSSKVSNTCTQTINNDVKNAVLESANNSTIDDKKKLKEMLKEMKDSLPKKPKNDLITINDKTKSAIRTETENKEDYPKIVEAPTLRIGSSNCIDKKSVAQTSSQTSTDTDMSSTKKVAQNITDAKNNNLTTINSVIITQPVVLVHTKESNVVFNKSDNYQKDVIQTTQTKNQLPTSLTDGRNENIIYEIDRTKSSTPLNLISKNKYDLNTPLKISSLLNPIYVPKITTSTNTQTPNLVKQIDSKGQKLSNTSETSRPSIAQNVVQLPTSQTNRHNTSIKKLIGKAVNTTSEPKEEETKTNISNEIKVLQDKTDIKVSSTGIKKDNTLSPLLLNDDKPSTSKGVRVDQHTRRRDLIQQLEQSIAKGDEDAAAEAAVKLAQLRLSCSVLSFSSQIVANDPIPPSTSTPLQINISKPVNELKIAEAKTITSSKVNEDEIKSAPSKQSPEKILVKINKQHTTDPLIKKENNQTSHNTSLASLESDEKTNCEIKGTTVSNQQLSQASTSKSFTNKENEDAPILVWVEDKEATRGPVQLHMRRNAVLGDLRAQAEKSLGLAARMQRWIIGKTLCSEDRTPLVTLAGPELSAPFYLCLVESDTKDSTKIQIEQSLNDNEGNVYNELVKLEKQALVSNAEAFECGVCIEECTPGRGVVLRECVHSFCKDCLSDAVRYSEEPVVSCPAMGCRSILQEREIRALVSPEDYEKWLARGLAAAESGTRNAFHCRTRDCTGWAMCDPGVRRFPCPVCKCTNCVPCQAIHENETCEQHRAKLQESTVLADSSQTDEGTQALLNSLISRGEALECPECSAVITKKWGCDWVKCSACKTEICWVTKGRRWGPSGRGDTSGGCRCGVDGKRCHPSCGYCH